ncbi:MAG: hypothetical protein WCH39_08420 [Schlesneria sp.]
MKRDVTYWRRFQIVSALLLLIAFACVAYFLSWESRVAILSCSDCGNLRVIQASTRWWRIESVGVADGHEFVVPPNHVHRWWQYDSRRQNAFQRWGWSRKKYEDGQIEWSGKIERDNAESKSEQRVEEWLRKHE